MSNALCAVLAISLAIHGSPALGQTLPVSRPAHAASSSASSQAVHQAKPTLAERTIDALMVFGALVLGVWAVGRLSHRRKLTLANSPGRPNALNPLHLLGLLLLYIIPSIVVGLVMRDALHAQPSPIMNMWLGMVMQVVMLAASLAVAAWAFRFGIVNGLGLNLRHGFMDSVRAVLAFLAVLPLVYVLERVAFQLLNMMVAHGWLPQDVLSINPALTASRQVGTVGRALIVLSVVVLAPLQEEVFFRGIIQSMLRHYLPNPWWAIILVSMFFAMFHPVKDQLPLFVLAVALGYNYERTGRLLPSILMHSFFNAVMLWQFMSTSP